MEIIIIVMMIMYICVCMCVFQSQLEELDYDDGRVEQLEAEQHALNQQIGGLQEKVDRLESRLAGQSLH